MTTGNLSHLGHVKRGQVHVANYDSSHLKNINETGTRIFKENKDIFTSGGQDKKSSNQSFLNQTKSVQLYGDVISNHQSQRIEWKQEKKKKLQCEK